MSSSYSLFLSTVSPLAFHHHRCNNNVSAFTTPHSIARPTKSFASLSVSFAERNLDHHLSSWFPINASDDDHYGGWGIGEIIDHMPRNNNNNKKGLPPPLMLLGLGLRLLLCLLQLLTFLLNKWATTEVSILAAQFLLCLKEK
ncbi:uncharacterized protein LOC124934256 [Impatiens glandulifera]|uniref:uncharacterized protein LOC124934256 n=1 Tax=Impatiens glandulifera TaxID=253017 RepID=UPI001FB197E4|nr:uncharacterized protein LOC124934256 [Impatiens glandulifera]